MAVAMAVDRIAVVAHKVAVANFVYTGKTLVTNEFMVAWILCSTLRHKFLSLNQLALPIRLPKENRVQLPLIPPS
ncbi:hypothetical protein JHK85_025755 [Glycine max]|nr:hypothetical protein JHK85_025755 [Glycine max]KAG5012995.1 hypothetical protein JHK86_025256 [Glycine max]